MTEIQDRQMNQGTRGTLPKKAFDSEYMTEWHKEVKFLEEKGIRYTFVRIKPEYGIRQYKYMKTPELFAALYEFYTFVKNEKNYNKLEKSMLESDDVQQSSEPITSFSEVIKEFANARSN